MSRATAHFPHDAVFKSLLSDRATAADFFRCPARTPDDAPPRCAKRLFLPDIFPSPALMTAQRPGKFCVPVATAYNPNNKGRFRTLIPQHSAVQFCGFWDFFDS